METKIEAAGAATESAPEKKRRGRPRKKAAPQSTYGNDPERMLAVGGRFNRACYSISPLAENFRIYIIALLQPLLAGHRINEPIGLDRMEDVLTTSEVGTAWGKVHISRKQSSIRGLQDRFNFTIPFQFFARGRRDSGRFYAKIRSALKELSSTMFDLTEVRDGYNRETYTGIISGLEFVSPKNKATDGREAYISFDMMGSMIELILDGTAGRPRFFETEAAGLVSFYSKRLYETFCSSEAGYRMPISVVMLKQRLRLEDKYQKMDNFLQRVIKPALKEINETTSIALDYELSPYRPGETDRIVTFTVLRNRALLAEGVIEHRYKVWPGRGFMAFLKNTVCMTEREMEPHLILFCRAEKNPDVMSQLPNKWELACRGVPADGRDIEQVRRERIAYFIDALKKLLPKDGEEK